MKNNIKVKRFYRISVGSILIQCALFLIFITETTILIIDVFDIPTTFTSKPTVPFLILFAFCYLGYIIIALYVTLDFYIGVITIDATKIYSNGDIRLKQEKLQYPAAINFVDIDSVKIIPWQRASNGKETRLIRPVPFLEVRTKTEKTKIVRFALYYMSFRMVKSLLIELTEKCIECGNPIEIDLDQAKKDFINARFAVKEETT